MDNDDNRKLPAKTPKKKEKDFPGNQESDKKVTPSKKQAVVSLSKRQVSASTPNSKKLSSEETVIDKGYANQLASDKRPADEGDHRGKASMAKKGKCSQPRLACISVIQQKPKFLDVGQQKEEEENDNSSDNNNDQVGEFTAISTSAVPHCKSSSSSSGSSKNDVSLDHDPNGDEDWKLGNVRHE